MRRILLAAIVSIASVSGVACRDTTGPEVNEVVMPPFQIQDNSIPLGSSFSQTVTYYAPSNWDGNIDITVSNIMSVTSPEVVEAYHVSHALETTPAPPGMKAWSTTVTSIAKSYGRVTVAAQPHSNPAGGISYNLSVSDKGE